MSLRDYFSNNKIFTGTEKPTQGKFGVGDIIVNIGPNSAEEPMWICVEAGTPGVWELCSGVNEEEIADIVQANALSAIDYTDGVDIQIDGGSIGNMNELQTTDRSSIVGAINELFQSANNGKQLIANAIGEPLNAEDTFSAMSNDINSLLSSFKTNMMNSGVTVESGDKFKQLIEKIKGLTEGEGNKGIQFASGTIDDSVYKYIYQDNSKTNLAIPFEEDLGFTPNILFVHCTQFSSSAGYATNDAILSNYQSINVMGLSAVTNLTLKITNITSSSFSIDIESFTNNSVYGVSSIKFVGGSYYAIGVGEEDTTLRDSLASILQEEGVSVTEEDDMASLISKVDEEFDRKNANSGLNIISATELPATGKENQICIISENPVDKFLVSSLDSDFSNLPNDTILLQTKHESTTHNYTVNNGNVISKYYISSCVQKDSIIPSYVYTSGQWVELTPGRLYFVKNKKIITNTEFGDIHRVSPPYVKVESDGIFFYSTNTTGGTCVTITNKTNLSAFRNIHIVAKVSSGGSSSKYIGVYSSSTTQNKTLGTSTGHPTDYVKTSRQKFTSKDYADGNVSFYRQEFDFDITDWTGEYYLGFYFYCYDTGGTRSMYIEEIYFY